MTPSRLTGSSARPFISSGTNHAASARPAARAPTGCRTSWSASSMTMLLARRWTCCSTLPGRCRISAFARSASFPPWRWLRVLKDFLRTSKHVMCDAQDTFARHASRRLMAKQVTLTIDGKQVTVSEGMLVVDAAKIAGIDIPVFCYHPKMEPVGMCRQCLVEIGRPMIDRNTGEALLDENGQPRLQFRSEERRVGKECR